MQLGAQEELAEAGKELMPVTVMEQEVTEQRVVPSVLEAAATARCTDTMMIIIRRLPVMAASAIRVWLPFASTSSKEV